jgi:digeranylgeranylglycerophospholipid reductase
MEFTHNLTDFEYDIVICGAGPAGLNAVRTLQLQSPTPLKIALLDKRDPWREPVACAEAVHKGGLYKLTEVDEDWIRSTIDGVKLISPNGTRVKYTKEDSGLILDRALMHYRLALRCKEAGAQCHFRSRVLSISPLNEGKRKIKIVRDDQEITLTATSVIDASGAGPSITKQADEPTLLETHFDVEPAVFGLVKGIACETNYIEMFFGHHYAPGGYAWVFPRDEEYVNVGICVGREYLKSHPPRKMFQKFVESYGEGVEAGTLHGGPIACGQPREPLASNGLIKTGDAADMVNPISRAGILEAMYGGKKAAEYCLKYLDDPTGDHSINAEEYLNDWMKHKGFGHEKLAKAKSAFAKIDDKSLDKAAQKLVKIPDDKRTMWRILWATVITQPKLLWQMRSIL